MFAAGTSAVKLAPQSFVDPFNYSLVDDVGSVPAILQLRDYLQGNASNAGSLTVKVGTCTGTFIPSKQ